MSEYTDPGIAFRETIVQGRDGSDWSLAKPVDMDFSSWDSWHWRCGRRDKKGMRVNGPRSLVEIATRVVGDNIHTSSAEIMADLPTRLLWRVCGDLQSRGGLCFHAWKIFSKHLVAAAATGDPDSSTIPMELYRYRKQIRYPSRELSYYTAPLDSSPTVDFLTFLSIHQVAAFQADELLGLARLKNLAILEIVENGTLDPQDKVSDHLIKGWSEMEDPFALLRILKINSNRTLTWRSLQYISKFPSLVFYDISGPSPLWVPIHDSDIAVRHGWMLFDEDLSRLSVLGNSFDRYIEQLLQPRMLGGRATTQDLTSAIILLGTLYRVGSNPVKVTKAAAANSALESMDAERNRIWKELLDTAASATITRTSEVTPEHWGIWVYALLEQLRVGPTLQNLGVDCVQASVAGVAMPPVPFAYLQLRGSGEQATTARQFRVYTFRRMNPGTVPLLSEGWKPGNAQGGTGPSTNARSDPKSNSQGTQVKPRKRQKLQDVMSTFGTGG
ncbi:hypothetical protein B0H66DRAFT_177250 [Apodospora peruviana]|uniref:Uncharacterized protein n=1 Tax=Apodospora peruviana TaxID=516989 RepID=A0AAE0IAP4_9PEZI|nr:hypothetical protein B0H66DRAFT_177250 [Apodospora peruviana]